MAQVSPFQTMPVDVAFLTFASLTIQDLVRFSSVEKRTNLLVHHYFERNSQKFRSHLLENSPLTDDRFVTALARFPHAVDIQIDTNSTACSLTTTSLQRITRLRSFHLLSLKGNTYDSFSETNLLAFLGTKKKIQQLTLQGCSCLTEAGLQQIVKTHTSLTSLSVDSSDLSDAVVQKVVSCMKRLVRLDLSGANTISDATLKTLATQAHNIRHLELKIYRLPFTKETVKETLCKMKGLESLALHGCQKMNDDMVETLAKNNPLLKHLYLFGASLTEKCLKHLHKYTPQLESLHLNDCEKHAAMKLKLGKLQFKRLATTNILSFSFWDYMYPIYLKQVEQYGVPHHFTRQVAYIHHLEALREERMA